MQVCMVVCINQAGVRTCIDSRCGVLMGQVCCVISVVITCILFVLPPPPHSILCPVSLSPSLLTCYLLCIFPISLFFHFSISSHSLSLIFSPYTHSPSLFSYLLSIPSPLLFPSPFHPFQSPPSPHLSPLPFPLLSFPSLVRQ